MGVFKKLKYFVDSNRYYILLCLVSLLFFLILEKAFIFDKYFNILTDITSYITWHTIFEFSRILVYFAIFVVSYYTYEQTKNLRFVLLGCVFLMVGSIDAFHTLSYKGMPEFFVQNTSSNRATTFWIIARLFESTGFVLTSFIPNNKVSKLNKNFFIWPLICLSFFTFIVVIFYPDTLPKMYIEGTGLTNLKLSMEYIIILLFLITMIKYLYEYSKTGEFLLIFFTFGLLLNIFSGLAFSNYVGVYDIYNCIGHIFKIVASYILFRVIFIYNVKKPYFDLSRVRNELKNYIENLDRLVNKRTSQLQRFNSKLLEDLKYAKDIQNSLLPSTLPKEEGVEFTARYFPAERLSGDFYNVFKLDEETIGLYIGDVSGHGVSAAMLTVFLKQCIKTRREVNEIDESVSPASILKDIYRSFNNTDFKDEVYIVLFYAIYNLRTKTLTFSSAGLNVPPLHIRNSTVSEINIKGFPICKFIEFYSAEYVNKVLKLKKGDKILFYTDGLIEVRNTHEEQFSQKRLTKILKENNNKSGSELTKIIVRNINQFKKGKNLNDDITFFIMEIK